MSASRATRLLLCFMLAGLPLARAGDKKQTPSLPPYIMQARTVAVLIDPEAGRSLEDPDANRIAQRDVEAALADWKRFEIVSSRVADLLIEVRRGSGKIATITARDPGQNERPISAQRTDGGLILGGQSTNAHKLPPSPQVEAGGEDDSFLVLQGPGNLGGSVEEALDSPAGWRLVRRDALKPHSVPAVAAFRKAVAEAEKAAAKP